MTFEPLWMMNRRISWEEGTPSQQTGIKYWSFSMLVSQEKMCIGIANAAKISKNWVMNPLYLILRILKFVIWALWNCWRTLRLDGRICNLKDQASGIAENRLDEVKKRVRKCVRHLWWNSSDLLSFSCLCMALSDLRHLQSDSTFSHGHFRSYVFCLESGGFPVYLCGPTWYLLLWNPKAWGCKNVWKNRWLIGDKNKLINSSNISLTSPLPSL